MKADGQLYPKRATLPDNRKNVEIIIFKVTTDVHDSLGCHLKSYKKPGSHRDCMVSLAIYMNEAENSADNAWTWNRHRNDRCHVISSRNFKKYTGELLSTVAIQFSLSSVKPI